MNKNATPLRQREIQMPETPLEDCLKHDRPRRAVTIDCTNKAAPEQGRTSCVVVEKKIEKKLIRHGL